MPATIAGAVATRWVSGGLLVAINDLPGPEGGIVLRGRAGATIIVNVTGIYIANGKGANLVMTGPTVTINDGALVVT